MCLKHDGQVYLWCTVRVYSRRCKQRERSDSIKIIVWTTSTIIYTYYKFIHHILNPFRHQGFDFNFNNFVNFGQWPGLVSNKKSILPIINKYTTPRSNQATNVGIFRFHSWMQVFGTTNPLIPMYCTNGFWITIPGIQCMVPDCLKGRPRLNPVNWMGTKQVS